MRRKRTRKSAREESLSCSSAGEGGAGEGDALGEAGFEDDVVDCAASAELTTARETKTMVRREVALEAVARAEPAIWKGTGRDRGRRRDLQGSFRETSGLYAGHDDALSRSESRVVTVKSNRGEE